MSEIKYQLEQLKASDGVLGKAIDDFSGYGKDFLAGIHDDFGKFNSDFATRMEKVTTNMSDTQAPVLMKSLKNYQKALRLATQEMEKLDLKISKQLSEK